jgi:Cadherin-like
MIPYFNTKPFTITQGDKVRINTKSFNTNVKDYSLSYEITGGTLMKGDVRVDSTGELSLFELKSNKVAFIPDGSFTQPVFKFEIRSGETVLKSEFIANIRMVNTAPSMSFFGFNDVLINGEEIVLDGSMFFVSDRETPNAGNLQINVGRVSSGQFMMTNIPIKTFSMADVENGSVSFKHDGKGRAPTFMLSVMDSDGKQSGLDMVDDIIFEASQQAEVDPVVLPPMLLKSPIRVTEGSEFILNFSKLPLGRIAPTTPDGEVFIESSANIDFLFDGVATDRTSFTINQIGEGHVKVKHNGSPDAPSMQVRLFGNGEDLQTAHLPFQFKTVNDAPVLSLNDLFATPGTTQTLDKSLFVISDEESPEAYSGAFLINVKSASNMAFFRHGVATKITTFNMAEVDRGLIDVVFKNVDPSDMHYTLTATDPYGATGVNVVGDVLLKQDIPTV